ncbi:MAG: SRPBCC domain-containing protein [Pseudomonadota bacterium]
MTILNPATSLEDGLLIERRLDFPRSQVWRAWTDPEILRRWICPKDFTVTLCEGDLRVGGAWRTGMRAPDDTLHVCGGIYREIVAEERLVFSHRWEEGVGLLGHETVATVTLADTGPGTLMRFAQTGFASVASRDGHHGGWSESFGKLDPCLAAL